MGSFRIFFLVVGLCLTVPFNASASAATLSVWLGEQVYTLDLESHTPAGLGQDTAATHYKGQVAGVANSWARMSLISGHWEGVVSLNGELFLIDLKESASHTRSLQSSVVQATPAAQYNEIGACALHEKDSSSQSNNSRALSLQTPTAEGASFNTLCASTVDGVCLMAELDFVFDQDFQNDFPADYESRATQLVNIMEGYYRNDLDIAFNSLTMTFLSSTVFSTTTDSFDLLNDISAKKRDGSLSFSSKNEALMQVITGREFDGSTVGIAWLEGLCDTTGYWSTSTAQVVAGNISLTALVAAHEVGHNLGAGHDGEGNACGSGFIMAPSLNPAASQFSSCSVAYIESAIGDANNQNACFDYPFDIEIAANNSGNSLVTDGITRNFLIDASVASQAINTASISGSINTGSGSFTAVTIDGNACTVAGDGQSYTCTLNSPTTNHSLAADMTVATGSYSVNHSVSVSQSQLSETDSGNNSVTDNFTVLLDAGSGEEEEEAEEENPPEEEEPQQPASNPETEDSGSSQSSESSADSGSSGGGGGGSAGGLLLVACALLFLTRKRYSLAG